jgi:predicted ribosomally synthesized peptide with SipW-like signal peptide
LRRNRNGLKRIGLLALALVLALGSLGVAYAAWTDRVYVQGTVNTGTLDADICGVSSTFVYKVPGLGMTDYGQDIQVDYYYTDTDPYNPPEGGTLVAQATSLNTSVWMDPVTHEIVDIDSAEMKFEGVFPGIDFMTDVELEYLGNVPAKISLAEITSDDAVVDELWDLWQYGDSTYAPHIYGIWIDAELSTDDGTNWIDIPNPDLGLELLGLQLEQDDLVHIQMHVLLPEEPAYEHLSLSFSGQITVIQWNEYEEPEP